MRPVRLFSAAAIAIVALAGCASTPPPIGEVAAARTSIERAQAASSRYAPAQLLAAQGKFARAQKAMGDEDYESARRLAREAEIDARLAASIAESEQAKQALAEVKKSIEVLKEEINRRPL